MPFLGGMVDTSWVVVAPIEQYRGSQGYSGGMFYPGAGGHGGRYRYIVVGCYYGDEGVLTSLDVTSG